MIISAVKKIFLIFLQRSMDNPCLFLWEHLLTGGPPARTFAVCLPTDSLSQLQLILCSGVSSVWHGSDSGYFMDLDLDTMGVGKERQFLCSPPGRESLAPRVNLIPCTLLG